MISIHTVANCNKRKSSEFRSWKSTFTISDPFSLARYISDFFGEQMGTKACLHRRRERERDAQFLGTAVAWKDRALQRRRRLREDSCAQSVRSCVRLRRKFGCAKTMMAERKRCKNCTRQGRLRIPSLPIPVPPLRPHQCIFQVESTTNHAPRVWRKRPSITGLRNHRFSHESHSFRDTVQPVTQHMKLTFEKKRNSNFPPAVL